MATTSNYSWTTPDDTDLVKDGAAAIRTLGSAIDTTVFTNAGAAVAKSTIDAKGDLLVGTADNTIDRLAVGTDGYTLVADSSTATGLKYAAPSSGDWVKITEIVNSSVASFSFTSIPSTYRNLVIIGQARSNHSAVAGIGLMRLNGDSGNNYDWVGKPDGFPPGGTSGGAQSYFPPFQTVANTATANNSFSFQINIPNYKGTTFYKTFNSITGNIHNTTAADYDVNVASGLWRNTGAITSILLDDASGGGGFLSGSVCTLYGVM